MRKLATVQVSRGTSALDKVAVFRPRTVTFKLFSAMVEINRVDGTIKQTPTRKDGPRAGRGPMRGGGAPRVLIGCIALRQIDLCRFARRAGAILCAHAE